MDLFHQTKFFLILKGHFQSFMKQNDDLIYSYLTLRKAVGWTGILLPFTLIFGDFLCFGGKSVLGSISIYYYSGMRDVFVGAVCAIALFMFFYRGYDAWDRWLTNLVGFFALGVAFFPTKEHETGTIISTVHFISAAGFFILLACISLFLFTKGVRTTRKINRNSIYIFCGIAILACILSIFIFLKFIEEEGSESSFVFWIETIALLSFGISWLTKGGSICPDEKNTPDNAGVSKT